MRRLGNFGPWPGVPAGWRLDSRPSEARLHRDIAPFIRKTVFLWLTAFLNVWIFTGAPLQATVYYVSPAGSDAGPGSFDQPFATVARGLAEATVAGDEVRLRAGLYQATGNQVMASSGVEGSPIVLGAYQDEVAVLDGSLMPDSTPVLQIAASWVVVEGLEIRNGQSQGITIFGPGTFLHDIEIRNNHIHDCFMGGIFIGAQNLADPPRDILVQGNDIHHNSRVNEHLAAGGGWPIASGSGVSLRVTYLDNKIHENWGEGLAFFLASFCTAHGNEVYDNFSVNIYLDNATDCSVEGNLVYSTGNEDFFRDGLRATGVAIANETYAFSNPSQRNQIVNNVLIDNHTAIRYGSYQEGGGLLNSLIAHNTAVGAVGAVLDVDGDAGHSGSRVANNVFLQTGSQSITWIDEPSNGVTYDHNLWFGGFLHPVANGPGDVLAPPSFESGPRFEALSYRPARDSALIGRAVGDVGVEADYLGEKRPEPLELGALEVETLFSDGFESGTLDAWSR